MPSIIYSLLFGSVITFVFFIGILKAPLCADNKKKEPS